MSENKYKVVKKILNENDVENLTDEQFVKLLEEEIVTGDGKQNAVTSVDFLNGGCTAIC